MMRLLKAALFLLLCVCCAPTKPPPIDRLAPDTPIVHLSGWVATWEPVLDADLLQYNVWWYSILDSCMREIRHISTTDTVDSVQVLGSAFPVVVASPTGAKAMPWFFMQDTTGVVVEGRYGLGFFRDSLYYMDREYIVLVDSAYIDWFVVKTYNSDKGTGSLTFRRVLEDTSTLYMAWDMRVAMPPAGWDVSPVSMQVSDDKAVYGVYRTVLHGLKMLPQKNAVLVAVSAVDSSSNESARRVDADGLLLRTNFIRTSEKE